MDAQAYLMSMGWTKGEALQAGGIKKPILVRHKKDTKGLGNGSNEHEAWWERLFDGQLKGLEMNTQGGISFDVKKDAKASGVSEHLSPLYRMFVKGGVLEGSLPDESAKDESKRKSKDKKNKKQKSKKCDKVSKEKKVKKDKKSKSKTPSTPQEEYIKGLIRGLNTKQPVYA